MKEKAGVLLIGVWTMAVAMGASDGLGQAADAGQDNGQKVEESQQPEGIFEPLIQVIKFQGGCEVNNPDVGNFAPAILNKAYPLGSSFRTGKAGSAVLAFSAQDTVTLEAGTEVVVTAGEKNPEARVLRLVGGSIKTNIRDNPPEGSFNVVTENACCKGLSGRGEYSLKKDADLETFQVATVTGAVRIEGPQFQIPALRAANTLNIQTAAERSFSRLTSVSGDFTVKLDNGEETPVSYVLSPTAVVKIWRENAPVGGRTIVSVLVISPKGMAQHRFAYAVGRPVLATGELVVQQEDAAEKAEEELPVLLSSEKNGEKKGSSVGEGTEKKDE